MLESQSSLLISQVIEIGESIAASIAFNLISDPKAIFEIIWTLDGNWIEIGIQWQNAKIGSIKCDTVKIWVVVEDSSIEDSIKVASWEGTNFPESESGSIICADAIGNSFESARVFVEFSEISGVKVIPDSIPMVEDKHIEIHSNQSPISNDVRIYFPATKSDLWTTESSLSKVSDYFSTLLSSEFAEGAILKEIKNDSSSYEKEFEDSDDEDDGYKLVSSKMRKDTPQVTTTLPFKEIKIDAIAHSTFRAFLHWIQTSHITFAPIASTFRLQEDASSSRRAAIDKLIKNSSLPRPVSPKSIYRLAHYYSIPILKDLALASIQSQLKIENIAFEVFDDFSKKYEEMRDIYVEFAVRNWNKVSESKAMEEMERLAEVGEIDISLILMKISRQLKFVKK